MKKIISLKEIILILMIVMLLGAITNVHASGGLVIGNNEYEGAQQVPDEKDANNNITNNETNNINNNAIKNSISNNKANGNNTALPQTGIEDYNIGILLIICIASAMYAYKKMSDYKKI